MKQSKQKLYCIRIFRFLNFLEFLYSYKRAILCILEMKKFCESVLLVITWLSEKKAIIVHCILVFSFSLFFLILVFL